MKGRMRTRARGLRLAGVLVGVALLVAAWRAPDASAWGGRYTTSTGEVVAVTVSDRIPVDENLTRAWAEFLTSLVHGSELARVTLYLAPYNEVQSICGFDALACYSGGREMIIAPLQDFQAGPTAQAVVAHEYGHHIARNRINAPWDALRYGPKRWASAVGVCSRAASGSLFPGGQGFRYRLDPGEGFAESYRVLNELRSGRPESPWEVVDLSLRPDQTALAALEQDVIAPWTGPTLLTRLGTFRTRGKAARTFSLATPLDGSLRITLGAPSNTRFRMSLYDPSQRQFVAIGRAGVRTLSTTICGQRALTIRVTQVVGKGRFRLSISRP
jgi:hypothetical protein